jgi:hypothetical protein
MRRVARNGVTSPDEYGCAATTAARRSLAASSASTMPGVEAVASDQGNRCGHPVPKTARLSFIWCGDHSVRSTKPKGRQENAMSILWIILIVVLVLALLGFFSRGYW